MTTDVPSSHVIVLAPPSGVAPTVQDPPGAAAGTLTFVPSLQLMTWPPSGPASTVQVAPALPAGPRGPVHAAQSAAPTNMATKRMGASSKQARSDFTDGMTSTWG